MQGNFSISSSLSGRPKRSWISLPSCICKHSQRASNNSLCRIRLADHLILPYDRMNCMIEPGSQRLGVSETRASCLQASLKWDDKERVTAVCCTCWLRAVGWELSWVGGSPGSRAAHQLLTSPAKRITLLLASAAPLVMSLLVKSLASSAACLQPEHSNCLIHFSLIHLSNPL